jgi:hypothetical protein
VAITDTNGRTAVLLDVRAGQESGWAGSTMVATPISVGDGDETVLIEKVADEYIVTGVAPADALRIIHHHSITGTDADLARYPVDDAQWSLFAGFVPNDTNTSTITHLVQTPLAGRVPIVERWAQGKQR